MQGSPPERMQVLVCVNCVKLTPRSIETELVPGPQADLGPLINENIILAEMVVAHKTTSGTALQIQLEAVAVTALWMAAQDS